MPTIAAPHAPVATPPVPEWRPPVQIAQRRSMVWPIVIVVGVVLLLFVIVLVMWLAGMAGYISRDERGNSKPNSESSLPSPTVSRKSATPAMTPAKTETTPVAPDASSARTEINSLMEVWAESIRQKNLNDNLKLYADELEVFYGVHNVAKSTVRSNRQTIFDKYYTSTDVQLSNLRVEVDQSGTRADVFYDNAYDWRGGARTMAGKSRNQMVLSRVNGQWLIVSEIHLQQYYERKQD